MNDKFNVIMELLDNKNKFSIYGFGNVGKLFINNINKDIIISEIYDSEYKWKF
ncbi:hypothetical protein [Brachyspira hyodysenteriae]|uniref:hypothetical protein n=1 Tax=Brachyspira hyodysenteriae TaxID=159 RepID=UPI0022CE0DD4|nr:hypothetical protein [Brachyspira hyodysenteriae]MDA0081936.1 hypothetical protein [Brachyspira hyodysenteriae]